MFKTSSIGFKLIMAFLAVSLVMLVGGVIQYRLSGTLGNTIRSMMERETRIDANSSIRAKVNRQLWMTSEITLAQDDEYFKQCVKDFEDSTIAIRKSTEGILNGGEGEYGRIYQTKNPKVVDTTREFLAFFNL